MFKGAKEKVANQFASDRTQPVMLITEDGRLIDQLLPIPPQAGSCEDYDARKSWLIDARNTVPDYTDPNHPKFYQVITERDVSPLALWEETGRKFAETEIQKIATNATEAAINRAEKRNDTKMMWAVIWASIGILSLILLSRVALSNYNQYFGLASGALAGLAGKRKPKERKPSAPKQKVETKEAVLPESPSELTPPPEPVPVPVAQANTEKPKLSWWARFWGKKQDEEPSKDPNTYVLDREKGRHYEYIEKPEGPLFRTTNQPDANKHPFVYLMKRDRCTYDNVKHCPVSGVMAVVKPAEKLGQLPEDLFDAQNDEDTGKWIATGMTAGEKMSITICVVIIGVLFLLNVIFYGRA